MTMKATFPAPGSPIPKGWYAALWNDVRAHVARGDGATIFTKETPTGTIISINPEVMAAIASGGCAMCSSPAIYPATVQWYDNSGNPMTVVAALPTHDGVGEPFVGSWQIWSYIETPEIDKWYYATYYTRIMTGDHAELMTVGMDASVFSGFLVPNDGAGAAKATDWFYHKAPSRHSPYGGVAFKVHMVDGLPQPYDVVHSLYNTAAIMFAGNTFGVNGIGMNHYSDDTNPYYVEFEAKTLLNVVGEATSTNIYATLRGVTVPQLAAGAEQEYVILTMTTRYGLMIETYQQFQNLPTQYPTDQWEVLAVATFGQYCTLLKLQPVFSVWRSAVGGVNKNVSLATPWGSYYETTVEDGQIVRMNERT